MIKGTRKERKIAHLGVFWPNHKQVSTEAPCLCKCKVMGDFTATKLEPALRLRAECRQH